MGRKSKQLRSETPPTSKNIVDLFKVMPRPAKMAPMWESYDNSSDESEGESAEAPANGGSIRTESTPPPEKMPESKADINLLKEPKAQSAADVALIREDLGAMTALIQAIEVNEVATSNIIKALQREMTQLKQTSTTLENKVAALED
ncbi:Hypothetical predicted protein [Pelobates cultripes]|uniref:Uncharacterized protein n=1 Tax=Pelobates cultripes TaxID=61616 RepID=A0AAD1S740_PELCU|nr:Hypothetical predicted protein [Pelobates cultripes]